MSRLTRTTISRLAAIEDGNTIHCPCCRYLRDRAAIERETKAEVIALLTGTPRPPKRPDPAALYSGAHCSCCARITPEEAAKTMEDLLAFFARLRRHPPDSDDPSSHENV